MPVLARIRVGDRGDLARLDRPARIGQQFAVQPALHVAGVFRRHQLGPREIGLQELVGNLEPAAVIAVEQMMAAGDPEILHRRGGSTAHVGEVEIAGRAPASSSTSMNENALLWPPCPSRSCSRRNDSLHLAIARRAMHRNQARDRMRAQGLRRRRPPLRPPAARLQDPARRSDRRVAAARSSTRLRRSSSVA